MTDQAEEVGEPDITALDPHTDILKAADRCDKCGVQAYYRVELGAGSCLDFCRKCFLEREQALLAVAKDVINETYKLEKFVPGEPGGMGAGNK